MAVRLVFMGTPDFAVPTLVELAGSGHDITAVYTRAPQPAGRGLAPRPSPIAREAERFGLPIFAPKTLKENDAAEAMRAHGADAAVVIAYGLILPPGVLAAPRLGCFNLHASLLPRWRGAAPINRAIMAGDTATGVTIMQMAEGLDTGPMAISERMPIAADVTAGELHDVLARLGADLMLRALGALERGALTLTPQPAGGVTYAAKIDKNETRIIWSKSWKSVHDHVRGLSPFPGAWCELAAGSAAARVKILRATRGEGSGAPGTVLDDRLTVACGEGAIQILQLQRAGKQPMQTEDFLRGTSIAAGQILG